MEINPSERLTSEQFIWFKQDYIARAVEKQKEISYTPWNSKRAMCLLTFCYSFVVISFFFLYLTGFHIIPTIFFIVSFILGNLVLIKVLRKAADDFDKKRVEVEEINKLTQINEKEFFDHILKSFPTLMQGEFVLFNFARSVAESEVLQLEKIDQNLNLNDSIPSIQELKSWDEEQIFEDDLLDEEVKKEVKEEVKVKEDEEEMVEEEIVDLEIEAKNKEQNKIEKLLEKISQNGIDSLSVKDKDFLNEASKRYKSKQ